MYSSAHQSPVASLEPEPLKELPGPPRILAELAAEADIRFNGSRPWDIRVYQREVYRRILTRGSLGFGEAYMDGHWDAERLDETFEHLLGADIDQKIKGPARLRLAAMILRYWIFNLQSPSRAFEVGRRHYDIGNNVYQAMLDPTMSYSCGYWKDATTLEQAQLAKLDLVCRKLDLAPGQRLLDIGCGWGGLAEHAARHYQVEVFGVTVSERQLTLARERCRNLPVRIELMDYRDISGRFDRVVSVGMFEHVGTKNFGPYFEKICQVMDDAGLFLLHTIGDWISTKTLDPWIERYIFPNGKVPSARQLSSALEGRMLLEDWHNFGPDYDRTLMAWWDNFDAAWPALREQGYDERFYRMWKYYLHCCAGYFRSRQGQLWQLVLAKRARRTPYRSIR